MGNVSTVSFARATHHEATKSPSVTARARMRECKGPSAPGEVPVKILSDGGSIPPTSTIEKATLLGGFFYGGGGESNYVRTCLMACSSISANTGGYLYSLFPSHGREKRMHAIPPHLHQRTKYENTWSINFAQLFGVSGLFSVFAYLRFLNER